MSHQCTKTEQFRFPPNRQILTFWLISFTLLRALEAKGRRAYEAEEGPVFIFWAMLGSSVLCYREHLLPFCSPGPLSLFAPSTGAVSGKRGMKTLIQRPPNSLLSSSKLSGYYVDRGGDWVKNSDESSNRAHRKRGRASHSSFPFALHSGRKLLGAVLKWYLVIIALAGHCSSGPVTQGHCKVIWTRGAVESLGTIHRPIIMRLIPKKVRTP